MDIFWTNVTVVMTGLSLALTGCGRKQAAKVEEGEMSEPMAGPPHEAASFSNALSSLEIKFATQVLNPEQERDLIRLIHDMRETAASRERYEQRQ